MEVLAPGALLRRLKEETREHHWRVEQASGLETSAPNSLAVHRFIGRMGGFTSALVRRLTPHLGEAWPVGGGWPVVDALEDDIRRLRLTPGSPQRLPRIEGESEAWGAAYVLEGAALGRRALARTLGRQYPNLRYLTGAAEEDGRWGRFRQAITHRAAALEPDAVVSGACETFDALEAHLQL